MSHPGASPPQHQGFVAVANVPYVLGLVLVDGWLWISKAEALPQEFDVSRLTGQKVPAFRLRVELLHELLEYGRSVLFRFEGDRIHEDVAAHMISQELLHLDQIGGDQRADFVAIREEK